MQAGTILGDKMIKRIFRFIAKLLKKDKKELFREWHSFWIGWAEMVCFRINPNFPKTLMAVKEMRNEWHYYMVGRAAGILTWVIIVIIVKAVMF